MTGLRHLDTCGYYKLEESFTRHKVHVIIENMTDSQLASKTWPGIIQQLLDIPLSLSNQIDPTFTSKQQDLICVVMAEHHFYIGKTCYTKNDTKLKMLQFEIFDK